MHADNDAIGQDALAFGLLELAFSTLAESKAIVDREAAVDLLKRLANGIDEGVATVPPEVLDGFDPEIIVSAQDRVAGVLREAIRKAERRRVG